MNYINWVQLLDYIKENIVDLAQTVAIVFGLIISALELRNTFKVGKLNTYFQLTSSHREVWVEALKNPELNRVLQTDVDLVKAPITPEETRFVVLLTSHLSSTFIASKLGLFYVSKSSLSDIIEFFSLPIPSKVWSEIKRVQDPKFVKFVDNLIRQQKRSRSLSKHPWVFGQLFIYLGRFVKYSGAKISVLYHNLRKHRSTSGSTK